MPLNWSTDLFKWCFKNAGIFFKLLILLMGCELNKLCFISSHGLVSEQLQSRAITTFNVICLIAICKSKKKKKNWLPTNGWGGRGASQVALVVKNLPAKCRRPKRVGFDPWVVKILWRRAWQLTLVLLLGESHGQRCLVGYSP